MDTLQINTNSGWIKYLRFVYNLDNSKYSLPKDTCSLRKALLFSIPYVILCFPVILLFYVLRKVTKRDTALPKDGLVVMPFIGLFFGIFSIVIFNAEFTKVFGLAGFAGQYYMYYSCFLLLLLLVGGLVVGLSFLIVYLWNKIPSIKANNVVSELYKSAKEKYCKKIEYV